MKLAYRAIKHLFPFALLLIVTATSVYAQDQSKFNKQADKLQQHLKNDFFSLSFLVQGLADFRPERVAGHNGFNINYGRFKLSGIFDNKFGYNLQATMLKSPSVIDANIYFKPISNLSIKTGLFKSPFTHEYLTGASSILFIDRSVVVNQLGTKRQLGIQVDTYTSNQRFRFTGGVFNGNNYGGNNNADGHFQYIGRAEAYLGQNSTSTAKVGVSISHEQKDTPATSGNLQSTFQGKQTLIGSYFSINQNKLLLDGEIIYGWMESPNDQEYNPYGYYFTAGYDVTPVSQLLLRWDSFSGESLTGDMDSIVAGFNYVPNKFTKLKLNYILPTDRAAEYSNFLAAIQIGF
ncbi:porin [Fodinibius salsisoli]|uniref:Phosphate-selective porin O and P n=1 Tax=Fodinibius salsisoli TaxID=2820877 RepID=A0ABT3PHL6_9BACT|nr:porin [Fodinibius salsisoli]MCW9705400.1 hypothetical protein [Fodinibius salsisoli]